MSLGAVMMALRRRHNAIRSNKRRGSCIHADHAYQRVISQHLRQHVRVQLANVSNLHGNVRNSVVHHSRPTAISDGDDVGTLNDEVISLASSETMPGRARTAVARCASGEEIASNKVTPPPMWIPS